MIKKNTLDLIQEESTLFIYQKSFTFGSVVSVMSRNYKTTGILQINSSKSCNNMKEHQWKSKLSVKDHKRKNSFPSGISNKPRSFIKTLSMTDFLLMVNQQDQDFNDSFMSRLRRRMLKVRSFLFTLMIRQVWVCFHWKIWTECAFWRLFMKENKRSIWVCTFGETHHLRGKGNRQMSSSYQMW